IQRTLNWNRRAADTPGVDAADGVWHGMPYGWMQGLAAVDQDQLWRRAHELRQAQHRLAELALGLSATAREMMGAIETAHAAVEAAERRVATVRVPRRRAGSGKKDLGRAWAAGREALQAAGL